MITKLALSNFRNFKSRVFEFSPEITVIVGPNTAGKTNILESLFLLSSGKSFKADLIEEMVKHNQDVGRAKGRIVNKDEDVLEVVLSRLEGTPKRKLLVNGVSRRLLDFAGNFKSVLFGPWHLDLVTASPSLRRQFLDDVLSQVDREYLRAARSYEKGIRQRNRILLRMREEGGSRSQLIFWNQLVIKNGGYITASRAKFIDFINSTKPLDGGRYSLDYDKSIISQGRLDQYKEDEIAAATTLVGPHRDDFIFQIRNSKSEVRNLSSFGSRGEQRMGVLWAKLAELEYLKEISQEKPTLLLDDIFSELDHEHRGVVLKASKNQQTIITTADPHYIEKINKLDKIEL